MRILVQKFGGTSLASLSARNHVVQHVKQALSQYDHLIVVVSAMGRAGDPYATDTLLQWIKQNGDALPLRERDLLLGCGEIISAVTLCSLLQAAMIPAVVLTGRQAGIITTGKHGSARIKSIDSSRIQQELAENKVVIVTGFQGENEQHELTTLGRGGSDTSAAALAVALQAERLDIFTDVSGIMTTDPKIVKEAQALQTVTYAEISNMAHRGAKVVHPRAVEIVMHAKLPMRVRSTFSDDEGTLVTHHVSGNRKDVQDRPITGLTYVSDLTQIEIIAEQGQYDLQLRIFKLMAMHQISVDFISVNPSGIVYTVFDREAEKAARLIEDIGYRPQCLPQCTKISIIGGGMNGVPGIMARIVEALTEENIQILQSADSSTTIWILVKNEHMHKGIQALHRKFMLHRERS